ncbi:hypothetical protein [Xanthomonas albilineans]|uniref:hypothetical protein n=1 Tax=Xanthomonas albilineans TaxID=29447 RepID=UPI000ADB289A|nr:hypothetical protein [Xanthomonas albilineans]
MRKILRNSLLLIILYLALLSESAYAMYCADTGEPCTVSQAYDQIMAFVNTYPPAVWGVHHYTIKNNGSNELDLYVDDERTMWRYYSEGCASQPALNSGWSSSGGNGGSCQNTCAYGPAASADKQTAGGLTYYSMAGSSPTGASCTMSNDADNDGGILKKDDCVKQGNLTQCVTPDGHQCAVSSSGKKFCWAPNETGAKVDGNDGATKSPFGANIVPPDTKPSDGGNWQQSGQGTSSSSSGGATNNYNVNTWTSNGSGGGGKGDGSDNGGGGNGNGKGNGNGDDKGDGNDPAGKGVGDLYKPSGNTVDSVFSDFKSQIQGAPIFQSATSFLGGCSGGGQCPNETWDGGQYAGKFDLSQFCSGTLGSLMGFAGYVFLAAMSAVAFRWALL